MGENRKIYAALLGAGTVGSGVYKLAGMQEEDICLKTGAHLEIKKILVRNPGKVREGIPQELFTDSWQEILEDPEDSDRHRSHGRHRTGQNLCGRSHEGRQTGGHRQQGSAGGIWGSVV